jgi:S-formylglutathione hydrolase FrmB
MARGLRYWTFLSEELPALARSFFPLSDAREDNFVAGLSMGGYGAFKLALRRPDKFAAAASLSGALDVAGLAGRDRERDPLWSQEMENIFGDPGGIAGSPNDLFFLAQEVARSDGPKPALFQCCGTEDVLHSDNLHFMEDAKSLGLNLTYEEGPGQHEWGFWDKWIQRVLEWLPMAKSV